MKRDRPGRVGFRMLLLLLFVAVWSMTGHAESCVFSGQFHDESGRYPDMTQTDIRAGLPWGGWFHCGPVAVSNGLIWFRERGLAIGPPASGDLFADQVEMARRLGRPRYMDTGPASRGTTVRAFLEGLECYLKDHSPVSFSILYMGWAAHPDRFSTGRRAPDLALICEEFAEGSAVFLDLGWYRFSRDLGVYRRNGGHYVTLVGYEWPEGGKLPLLYIHDPAPWSGRDRQTHRVELELAGTKPFASSSGTRIGSLEPYLRIREGLPFKKGTELALLEGAVILRPRVRPAVPWLDGCSGERTGIRPFRKRLRR